MGCSDFQVVDFTAFGDKKLEFKQHVSGTEYAEPQRVATALVPLGAVVGTLGLGALSVGVVSAGAEMAAMAATVTGTVGVNVGVKAAVQDVLSTANAQTENARDSAEMGGSWLSHDIQVILQKVVDRAPDVVDGSWLPHDIQVVLQKIVDTTVEVYFTEFMDAFLQHPETSSSDQGALFNSMTAALEDDGMQP